MPASSSAEGGVRHRVFNEANVAAGLKRRSLAAAMDKAAALRENMVQEKKEKASSHCRSVREKAAKKADDAALTKAAHTKKMVAAEINRLSEIKKRCEHALPPRSLVAQSLWRSQHGSHARRPLRPILADGALGKSGACPALVIVGDFETPPEPLPHALLRRLAANPKTLLATATARQLRASAHRRARAGERAAANAMFSVKVASAASRRGMHKASTEDMVAARGLASARVLASRDAARKRLMSSQRAKHAAAAKARATAAANQTAKLEHAANRCVAAAEKRAFNMRVRAKSGIIALHEAAIHRRRVVANCARVAAHTAAAARCAAAAAKRQGVLDARVTKASAKRVAKSVAMELVAAAIEAANDAGPSTAAVARWQLLVRKLDGVALKDAEPSTKAPNAIDATLSALLQPVEAGWAAVTAAALATTKIFANK